MKVLLDLLQLPAHMLKLTQDIRGKLGLVATLGLVLLATYVAQSLLLAQALNIIFTSATARNGLSLGWIALGLVILILVRSVLLWWREVAAKTAAETAKEVLRERLYRQLFRLGPGYLERTSTGTVQSTVVDGIEKLEGYLGYYVPQVFVASIGPLVIVTYMFMLDWVVALVVLVAIPFTPIARNLWRKVLGERGLKHWGEYAAVNTEFLDTIQGLTTLKLFNASQRQGQKLEKRFHQLYRATMGQLFFSLFSNTLIGLATTTGTVLAVGVGTLRLAGGELSLSHLLVILFLTAECFRPQLELSGYWHLGYMGLSAANGLYELLEARPEVENPVATPPLDPAWADQPPTIVFEGVSFAYKDGTRPALKNLNLKIAPGERVAVVGRSGAGKSTLVALLLRFFDPTEGRITLAGRDLRDYELTQLRQLISVVSQETYLFYGTVADNLRLAKPSATQVELEAACRAAQAHNFIEQLAQGYQTRLGERGTGLSGGERQRLAIARALLKNAPLLILDEATSSVDAVSETAIVGTLEQLSQGRTTLVIAHRLSTIMNADRILVLENGQVVEEGRHSELLELQETYSRLVGAQREMLQLG